MRFIVVSESPDIVSVITREEGYSADGFAPVPENLKGKPPGVYTEDGAEVTGLIEEVVK